MIKDKKRGAEEMRQDSKCPVSGVYREIIGGAQRFGIDPWLLALFVLAVAVFLGYLILRPLKTSKKS